ncbi:MAG: patatin-like phospholipase family protein [Bacteroidales bacterium]|jgi:predicted acylesterase/phospholipase RssA|nr:patatin-like phospholipase family protein [Bacteroidales bacterium]
MRIALAFSGGGYRASAFNLGVITYLNRVSVDGATLLDKVTALSTVSGGTITGAKYALGIKKGETLEEIYASLYRFFLNTDLISGSIERLCSTENWDQPRVKSLISAFADLYDDLLFQKDKFGVLLDEKHPIHLKHISFNATEFSTGLQFRFQVSEKIFSPITGIPYDGIIGNFNNNISGKVAKDIRMADILAASSCFPGGFEPINFPTDFVLPDTDEIIRLRKNKKYPIGLMDGGIVDNQGIEPLLLAENRMRLNSLNPDQCNFDLIIVSDVSSPYMEGFTASIQQKENWWRRLTLQRVKLVTFFTVLVAAGLMVLAIREKSIVLSVTATILFTLSSIVALLFLWIKKQLKNIGILDVSKLKKFRHLKLIVFENLLKNRVLSILRLTGSVFMKHIRRLNFRSVYENDYWANRRIMNAIYELRAGEKNTEKRFEKGELDDYLKPSAKIQEVSSIAAGMETTLWFEKRHWDARVPDSLIACGQYSICWNLLGYIGQIKRDTTNTNKNHQLLLSCEDFLRKDWEKFKENPYWLVEKYQQEMSLLSK